MTEMDTDTIEAIQSFCRANQATRGLNSGTSWNALKELRRRQQRAKEDVLSHMRGGQLSCAPAGDGGAYVRLSNKRVQQHLKKDMVTDAVRRVFASENVGAATIDPAKHTQIIFEAIREARTTVRPHVFVSANPARSWRAPDPAAAPPPACFTDYARLTRELETRQRDRREALRVQDGVVSESMPAVEAYMRRAGVDNQEIALRQDGGERTPHFIRRKTTLRKPAVNAAFLRRTIMSTLQAVRDAGCHVDATTLAERVWSRIAERPPESGTRITLEKLRPTGHPLI